MGSSKKQHFQFKGDTRDDAILVGSHGDARITVSGTFELSGIIYCPKYTVTLTIVGDGSVALRGICNKLVVRRMSGNCELDLRDFTSKEMRFEAMKQRSKVFAGKTRVITKANLFDDAILLLTEKPLMTSAIASGKSQIIFGDDYTTIPLHQVR
jgi:hypothetical protein